MSGTSGAGNRAGHSNPMSLNEIDAMRKLEELGELTQYVDSEGVVQPHVKHILQQVPKQRLITYLGTRCRGTRLMSLICSKGGLEEVRYAFEVLHMSELSNVGASSRRQGLNLPLHSALTADNPLPDVIDYLARQGYPILSEAYHLWMTMRSPREPLRTLLLVLLTHGREAMPSKKVFLNWLVIDIDLDPLIERQNFRSPHIDVLLEFISFGAESSVLLYRHGLLGVMHQISRDQRLSIHQRCHVLELCEVLCHCYHARNMRELRYFREAIELKRNNPDRERPSYRQWQLANSIEDIERIERQMAEGNFVEVTWQLLLLARKSKCSISALNTSFFRGVTQLQDLVEMKHFLLTRNFCHCLEDRLDLAECLREHCEASLRAATTVTLSSLDKLYQCLDEAFASTREHSIVPTTARAICIAIARLDVNTLDEQIGAVRRRLDETMFITAYGCCSEPPFNNAEANRDLQNIIEAILIKLLIKGATLLLAPGHTMSTLRLLLNTMNPLPDVLNNMISRRLCCRLDVVKARMRLLGNVPFINNPRPLKCLAAMAIPPGRYEEGVAPRTCLEFISVHPRNHIGF